MKRRRYATRDELAELIAPYLSALDEIPGGYTTVGIARTVLDALAEMQAPVDQLVRITVDKELPS